MYVQSMSMMYLLRKRMAWCSSESDLEATLAKAIGYRSFESSYVNSPTSAYFTFSKINNCAGFDEIAGCDIA